jgi:hypothetical protein
MVLPLIAALSMKLEAGGGAGRRPVGVGRLDDRVPGGVRVRASGLGVFGVVAGGRAGAYGLYS